MTHWIDLFIDVVIRCLPGSHNILPDGTCIFLEVLADGNKVKKTEKFTKELTGPSWRLDEDIHL